MVSASGSINRFFKHSAIYAFGSILNRATAFLLLPIYTNYLSVAEYGTLELFYVISTAFSGLLSVGIAHATLRFYYEYNTDSDRNAVVTTNLTVSLFITSIGALIVGFWHEPLALYILGGPDYSRGVLIVLTSLVLELSSQVCLAYLRAKEYSIFFVVIMFFKLIIQLVANTYLVIFQGMGLEGVLTGNLLAVAFGWIVLTLFVVRQCGYRFDWPKIIPILKYSFPFLLSSLTGLISTNVDRFLINHFLTLQALGIYALAFKFSSLLDNLIGEPFNRSYGAFRFSVMKSEDAAVVQVRIVRYLFMGLSVLGLGIIYFTYDLLVVMSKPDYWPAADILPLLMVGSLLRVITYPLQTGILYEKKTRYIFYIGLLSAITSSVANFLLIQWAGLIGACIALVLTATIILIVTNRISQRYFSVRYEYRRLCMIAAITIFFYLLSLPFIHQPLYWGVPLKLSLYLIFVILLINSKLLDPEEIAWLKSAFSKIFRKNQVT